jgi:hypothetical protein
VRSWQRPGSSASSSPSPRPGSIDSNHQSFQEGETATEREAGRRLETYGVGPGGRDVGGNGDDGSGQRPRVGRAGVRDVGFVVVEAVVVRRRRHCLLLRRALLVFPGNPLPCLWAARWVFRGSMPLARETGGFSLPAAFSRTRLLLDGQAQYRGRSGRAGKKTKRRFVLWVFGLAQRPISWSALLFPFDLGENWAGPLWLVASLFFLLL